MTQRHIVAITSSTTIAQIPAGHGGWTAPSAIALSPTGGSVAWFDPNATVEPVRLHDHDKFVGHNGTSVFTTGVVSDCESNPARIVPETHTHIATVSVHNLGDLPGDRYFVNGVAYQYGGTVQDMQDLRRRATRLGGTVDPSGNVHVSPDAYTSGLLT